MLYHQSNFMKKWIYIYASFEIQEFSYQFGILKNNFHKHEVEHSKEIVFLDRKVIIYFTATCNNFLTQQLNINLKKQKTMKIKVLILFMSLLTAFSTTQVQAQLKADDVLGVWLNQDGDAHVEISKRDGKYYGKIVWIKEPIDSETGKPKTDKHNPDPKLKTRPTLGLEILKGFSFDGKKEWSGGEIYDPKTGKTYSSFMAFENKDKLKIRGYIGVSLLGRTTQWTRVK